MGKLKIATLFSGIGTPENALKALQVEHETIFACEIDKYARVTYIANNDEPNTFYEDVYNIDGNKYKNQIDILIGGSPCQSFSIAGKRLGTSCPRGNLIYEYFRIVEESKPKVFIYENVKGFLSIDKGETFENFKNSFKEIGYTVYHQVLNTKDYGIPQNRERIYIVGFKDNVDFNFQQKQELKLRLKDMLEDNVDSKYLLSDKLVSYFQNHKKQHDEKGNGFGWSPKEENDETANTITARCFKMGATDNYIKLNQTHQLNIKGNDSIKRIYSSDGLCPSLTTMQGGHREPKVAIEKEIIKLFDIPKEILNDNERQRRVYSPDGISPAVIARSDSAKILLSNGLIEVDDEVRVKEAVKKGYTVAEEGDSINVSVPSSKTRRGRVGKQVAQTLDTACNQVVFTIDKKYHLPKERLKTCLESNHSAQRVYCPSGIAPTISAGSNGGGKEPVKMVYSEIIENGKDEIQRIKDVPKVNYIFRKLTPRECFRLQGFDDTFIFPKEQKHLYLQFVYDKINKKEIEWNVKSKIVKEKQLQTNMETYVLCTTKEWQDMEQLMKIQKEMMKESLEKIKDVNIVMIKLEEREQKVYATNTIKWTDCIKTLYLQIVEKENQEVEVIFEDFTENQYIGQLWKIKLEENLCQEKLYITLILLKQIIMSKTYIYVKTTANILKFTASMIDLSENYLKIKLSSLKMEYTKELISDSQLYKQAGNGMSRNILEMLFTQILIAYTKHIEEKQNENI